jgi:hypothetical protein
MPDILIRDVNASVVAAIQTHAAAAGQTQQQYLSALLEGLVQQPVVRATYGLKAFGPDGARMTVSRWRDGLSGQGGANLSQTQADAYKRVTLLVERNEPGDREQAIGLLKQCFEEVFEVAG